MRNDEYRPYGQVLLIRNAVIIQLYIVTYLIPLYMFGHGPHRKAMIGLLES